MQKNGSMEEVSTKTLPVRRSQRITKGKAPIRYGTEKIHEKPDFDNVRRTEMNIDEVSTRSEKKMNENPQENSSIHKSNKVSSSKSRRYRQLKIELDRERKLAEIEKKLVHRETELKMAELETTTSNDVSNDEETKTMTSKSSFVQKWVNMYNPNPEISEYKDDIHTPQYSYDWGNII
ncbi:hypothetical protein JTB14_021555 [Gonioctena quinquepunctata]|nr:hypothetical protein JTB14_021555 [Gonioctena quinquepunctata]